MSKVSKKPPMDGLTYQAAGTLSAEYSADEERFFTRNLDEASVITSRVADQGPVYHAVEEPSGLGLDDMLHKVVLDIDMPAVLVPSSTPGHFHLLIDHELMWTDYVILLRALVRAGLVEPGYVKAAERRGFTAVRLPWIRKPAEPIARVDGSGVLPENQENF
jgi:hypothetical protein